MQTTDKGQGAPTMRKRLFSCGGGTADRRGVAPLALIALLLATLIALSGCGSSGNNENAAGETEGGPDGKAALEEIIEASLTEDTVKTVSEIKVNCINGEYSVTIRTVAVGGLYIPDVIEQTAGPVFDKAAELGLTISSYEVTEYSESNAEGISNMIAWRSKDGKTGTYSDDTGEKPVVKPNTTLEDVRGFVE